MNTSERRWIRTSSAIVIVCLAEYAAKVAFRPHRHVTITRNSANPMENGTKPPSKNLSELATKKEPSTAANAPNSSALRASPHFQYQRPTGNIATEVATISPDTANP